MVKLTSEKPAIERNESQFKGVRKRKWGKFVTEIRLPNSRERIWLGSYDTAEKAARAFDAASFCLRGHSATLNFPNNPPPDIGCGRDNLTPSEIQAVAARFANSEPPLIHSTSTFGLESESRSPSVSDGTDLLLECEWPAVEHWGTYNLDYGIFPGFDDFTSDVIGSSSMTANIGDEEDNADGIIVSESFLWNF